MRARNWPKYKKTLVQRGSLTFLIDPKILKTLSPKACKHRKGRPRKWIKLHVAIDEKTPEIVAEMLTDPLQVMGKHSQSLFPRYLLV